MIEHTLKQDAYLITTTTDKYGSQNQTSSDAIKCRFRYITEIDKGVNMESVVAGDANMWFKPDENIVEGSILKVDDNYWRVTRLIRARRMSGDTIEFLKALVSKHDLT